jgi:hypothetical protein
MSEAQRVLAHSLATRVDHHLDASAGLADIDRSPLVLRKGRAELDSTKRVQRDRDDRGARDESLAGTCVHLYAFAVVDDRRDRGREPPVERGGVGDGGEQRPRAAVDRHTTSRELGELEAVARERVPAQDRHRSNRTSSVSAVSGAWGWGRASRTHPRNGPSRGERWRPVPRWSPYGARRRRASECDRRHR